MKPVVITARVLFFLTFAMLICAGAHADTPAYDFGSRTCADCASLCAHSNECADSIPGICEPACAFVNSKIVAPAESWRSLKSLPLPPTHPADSRPTYSRKSNRTQRA